MSKLGNNVSATIVLIFKRIALGAVGLIFSFTANASPQRDIPEGNDADQEAAELNNPQKIKAPDENMSITPPPPINPDQASSSGPLTNARYYPYRQQMTIRGGIAGDFPKIDLSDSVLGFSYLFPKFLSPKLEAGADLHEEGRGHLHIGARWIYFERSYWRPSLSASLDHYINSKEGLATLARKEDWYVRGGIAAEYVVWNPFSLRAEMELLANFDNVRMVMTMAVSRGW